MVVMKMSLVDVLLDAIPPNFWLTALHCLSHVDQPQNQIELQITRRFITSIKNAVPISTWFGKKHCKQGGGVMFIG